ncbi:hypothetical protein FSARC_771 [Fusarium sarcochroum]|uniref:Uncharacterized protein n=1 Tax=Fusarium sarcochroum TaxID=1208366 RepID=A0A8H4XFV6_9HYPO|nr:hypothetical protein FSARC_771 [Fusarium sarcochroum]
MAKLYNLIFSLLMVGATATPVASNQPTSNRWIVSLKTESSSGLQHHVKRVTELHASNLQRRREATSGIEVTFEFPGFAGYAGSFDDETLEALKADPDVTAIEEDKKVYLSALTTQNNPPWGLSAISHADPPLVNASYIYDASAGEGTFSYVLDSGLFAQHNDFEGRAVLAYDATGGEKTDHSHGTHVAGIIGGKTYGVAKKTSLLGVQVTGTEIGQLSWILDALSWTSNDVLSKGRVGKSIINMSITTTSSTIVNEAVKSIIDSGIPVIVAAGNSNADAADYSPANLPEAITVAASNRNFRRWSASNWGSTVDLFAPGQDIPSTWVGSANEVYTTSGTSMASPYVAGVAAYLLGLEGSKSPAALKARILDLASTNLISDAKEVPNLLVYNGNGA